MNAVCFKTYAGIHESVMQLRVFISDHFFFFGIVYFIFRQRKKSKFCIIVGH